MKRPYKQRVTEPKITIFYCFARRDADGAQADIGSTDANRSNTLAAVAAADVPTLMAYVDSMGFPPLSRRAEEEIEYDVSRIVDQYFPDWPAAAVAGTVDRQSFIRSLVNTVKFFSLFVSTIIVALDLQAYIGVESERARRGLSFPKKFARRSTAPKFLFSRSVS